MNDPRETDWEGFQCEDFPGDHSPSDVFHIQATFAQKLRDRASVFFATRDDFPETERSITMLRGFGKSRMWAQYASNHSGICLVFDRCRIEAAARHALGENRVKTGDVDYRRAALPAGAGAFGFNYAEFKASPLDYLCRHAQKWDRSLFFRKHEDWKDEREWRMATVNVQAGGKCICYGDALKYVVLGHGVEDKTVRAAKRIFDGPVLRLRYQQWKEDYVLNVT